METQVLRIEDIEDSLTTLLGALGLNLSNPNLEDTPKRVASQLLKEVYPTEPEIKTFPSMYKSMIVCLNHITFSRCPHHLERVKLLAHIGYLPDKDIIGLSKIPRIVDFCASGLKLQEDITVDIADYLMKVLKPKGCGVMLYAQHNCIQARGVESDTSIVVTSALRGAFLNELDVKEEFIQIVNKGGRNEL